jgi:PhnB protein
MQINTYLNFNGTCEEAFQFYARTLGGTIEAMIPHRGTPAAEHVAADWQDKIMHAKLTAGDAVLMGSDAPADGHSAPGGFAVAVHTQDPAEADRIFAALAENATAVTLPIQQTFWSIRFGMVTDRFGVPWMVNCAQAPAGAEATAG